MGKGKEVDRIHEMHVIAKQYDNEVSEFDVT
jgi:hypothetical protein